MARKLHDWISSFIEYTTESEPPHSFRLWTAISVIAACMRRKCVLHWDKPTFPNMYIVLASPPGAARKGTAMEQGLEFLRPMGVKMAADATTLQALIQDLEAATDASVSGTQVIPHASISIFSRELTVFLGYQNKELITHLCDWFDCPDPWKYKTKGAGVNDMRNVWVNFFAATTPDQIREALPREAIGSGLTSRIIFVFERTKGKRVPFPFLSRNNAELKQALALDLEDISVMSGEYTPVDEFKDAWEIWYEVNSDINPLRVKHFAAYASRRPNHILRLSMILSASARGDYLLTKEDLERAIQILEATEVKMPEVFMGFGKSTVAETLYQVQTFIYGQGSEGITEAQLHRHFYEDADMQTMEAIISQLKRMGRINETVTRSGTIYKWRS